MSKSGKPQRGRKCLFCGGGPLTKEHSIPRWIDKYFPNPSEAVRQVHIKGAQPPSNRGFRRTLSGGEIRKFCRPCNVGWMSGIERTSSDIVGPMVSGFGTLLDRDAQLIVAAWTLKTCLAHIAVDLPNHDRTLDDVFRYFYETKRPSSLHHVMIGALADNEVASFFRLQPIEGMALATGQTSHGHFATVAIGHFIGQVIYFPVSINVEPPSCLPLVWPLRDEFIWPRGLLAAADLDRLSKSPFPRV